MSESERIWHPETITPATERAVECLVRASAVTSFYLAGGTGLALHLGHRLSEDLDFFSESDFPVERLLAQVQSLPGFALLSRDESTLHIVIARTNVSFLGYPYPLLFPLQQFRKIRVADPRDIAGMKINAIASRGTRRDFVDLYAMASAFGLKHLMELFEKKFAAAHYSMTHIYKSLLYFDDAEKDPLPNLLADISWTNVKQYFEKEVPPLVAH